MIDFALNSFEYFRTNDYPNYELDHFSRMMENEYGVSSETFFYIKWIYDNLIDRNNRTLDRISLIYNLSTDTQNMSIQFMKSELIRVLGFDGENFGDWVKQVEEEQFDDFTSQSSAGVIEPENEIFDIAGRAYGRLLQEAEWKIYDLVRNDIAQFMLDKIHEHILK